MFVMHRLFFKEYTKKKTKLILERGMEELEWWRDFAGSCMHFIFTMCRYYFLNYTSFHKVFTRDQTG